MITRLTFPLLLLLPTLAIAIPPFNISRYLYPKSFHELRPQRSVFFQDVLEAISEKRRWNLEDVVGSKINARKVKWGILQRYDFRVQIGKSELMFELSDRVSWRKLDKGGNFESLAKEIGPKAVLDTIRIEGPFELRVSVGHEMSLWLPLLNTSYSGLSRVLVGEGITVEVKSAQGVSLLHTLLHVLHWNNNTAFSRVPTEFLSLKDSSCMPLLPIDILGSVSVTAYNSKNSDANIRASFLSRDSIKLLPEKCYYKYTCRKRAFPIDSLKSKIALLENFLRNFLIERVVQNAGSSFLKVKIHATLLFHFQLELERDIRTSDKLWTTLADWKTRPSRERQWFEVLAKIKAERLKPLMIKRVRPYITVDSSDWSNLMSNISFTRFPSALVPPEALTLDVKW